MALQMWRGGLDLGGGLPRVALKRNDIFLIAGPFRAKFLLFCLGEIKIAHFIRTKNISYILTSSLHFQREMFRDTRIFKNIQFAYNQIIIYGNHSLVYHENMLYNDAL